MDRIQVDCILRVLSKPEISNAIKLKDLETLMSNFGPPSPRDDELRDPNEAEGEMAQAAVPERKSQKPAK